MASAFAGTTKLEEIHVVSTAAFNQPGTIAKVSPLDCSDTHLPPELIAHLHQPDSALPDSRDLRRFVRKLPHLRLLSWTGRDGKGAWRFTKTSSLVNLTFTHSAITTLPIYLSCQSTAPSYPFEEVHPNPFFPGFMSLPTAPKTMSADFPALSRCTTADSGIPSAPRTPPAKDVVVVPIEDTHEHLGRLSISSASGPAQVLRLDITKASKAAPKKPRVSTSTTNAEPPVRPAAQPAHDKGKTASSSKSRKRQGSSSASSGRGRSVPETSKIEKARKASENQGGAKKTLKTTKEAQDGWTVVGARRGSGK